MLLVAERSGEAVWWDGCCCLVDGARRGLHYPVRRQRQMGIRDRGVATEAGGGVTLETIRDKAETGVDFISVGRLTQSAPAADIGLDFAQV